MRYAILLLAAFATPVLSAERTFPAPTGNPVIDAADIIPDNAENALNTKLLGIAKQTKHQVAVLTLPTLGGADLNEYSIEAARHYGFGSRERSDGVLWTIIPSERKDRIEVGDGLQGVLTDAESSRIRRDVVVPQFRAGNIVAGIDAGVDAIGKVISTEAVTPQQVLTTERRKADEAGSSAWAFILAVLAIAAGSIATLVFFQKRADKRRAQAAAAAAAHAEQLMDEQFDKLHRERQAEIDEQRLAQAEQFRVRQEKRDRDREAFSGRHLSEEEKAEMAKLRNLRSQKSYSTPQRADPPKPVKTKRAAPQPSRQSESPISYVPVVDPEPYRYSSPPPPPPPPPPSPSIDFSGDSGSYSGGGSGGEW